MDNHTSNRKGILFSFKSCSHNLCRTYLSRSLLDSDLYLHLHPTILHNNSMITDLATGMEPEERHLRQNSTSNCEFCIANILTFRLKAACSRSKLFDSGRSAEAFQAFLAQDFPESSQDLLLCCVHSHLLSYDTLNFKPAASYDIGTSEIWSSLKQRGEGVTYSSSYIFNLAVPLLSLSSPISLFVSLPTSSIR